MDKDRVCYTVRVHGRVQGVGFRYSTRAKAEQFGVAGWVRNEPDGTVSVKCEGPSEAVQRFLAYLKQGPPTAEVTSTEVSAATPEGRGRFSVR
ncbi:MAG: acylphosphatase [Spirochaetales bacterium]